MKRIDHATKDTDLFGAGKHGFTSGVPGSEAASVIQASWLNHIQEELANAIEDFGTTISDASYTQLYTILSTLLTSAAGHPTLQASSATPVFASNKTAHDHTGNPTNKWKNFLEMQIAGSKWVRLFAGDETAAPGGDWALTVNAKWNPATSGSGGQNWDKDVGGDVAYALISDSTGLNWRQRGAGAGTWTSWSPGVGNVTVGGEVSADSLDVTNGGAFGASVETAGQYNYTTNQPRVTVVPYQYGIGTSGVTLTTVPGSLTLAANSRVEIPLRLPEGAEINEIRVCVASTVSADWTLYCDKRADNYTTGVFGATSNLDTATGTVTAGTTPDVAEIDCGGEVVQDDTTYVVSVANAVGSTTDLLISSVQVNWTDPGPRN